MKVLGLVVEYNPFHNGHLYHLEQSKKVCSADYTVCVISGNFIQRGEPALVNKWARARMALSSGVDLVIELPTVYSMASAEYFAFGAVKLLDSLGITDCMCFGSEGGKIEELNVIANVLIDEPPAYKTILRENLSSGISYPSAREIAIKNYLSQEAGVSEGLEDIMGSSNNILGIEYIKALKRLKSTITPYTITRKGNSYNSGNLTGCISSATSIRNCILDRQTSSSLQGLFEIGMLKETMPPESIQVLEEEFRHGRGPVTPGNFSDMILGILRGMSIDRLKNTPYVSEGLENRIKMASENSGSLGELIDNISTKRYPRTRIQRILFNALTGLTLNEFTAFNMYGGPQYVRVLGFNKNGRHLISLINKKASLPVIVKTADSKKSCNPLFKRMLELEAFATDMYVLGYTNPVYKKAGQEFTQNVVIK